MSKNVNQSSLKIIQDMDQAILVMRDAGKWLSKTGKNPSKWWRLKNLNRAFLLQHAKPHEFHVVLIDKKPAAAAVLQDNERNQSWKSVDNDHPKSALYIHWLCVTREFSGKNFPKVMIDTANDLAKKRNIPLLRLETNAEKMKLRQIYENLGFNLMAVKREYNYNAAFYQKEVL